MHLPRNSSSTYDDLPYGSCWRPLLDVDVLAAHPDRAAWQHLTQEKPPTAVCDLACGSGRQVLQGALLHPHIEFLGVDGSSAHIGEATALKNALGIKNAHFECADLLEWSPAAARFDLITCSGTYPWVPDSVRERILEIIARTLADDGFAVLHVLSLPACLGLSEAQRQLLDAVGDVHPMSARLQEAKRFVPRLAPSDAPAAPELPMVGIVRTLLRKFVERNDAGAAHEFLGSPVRADYFRDFEAQVKRHGLNVVSDANPTMLCDALIPHGPMRDLYERTRSWSARQEILDMFAGIGGGRDVILAKRGRSASGSAVTPRDALYGRVLRTFDETAHRHGALAWHQGRALAVTDSQSALWEKIRAASPESVRIESVERADAEFLCIHGYIELATRATRIAALHGAAPETVPLARAELTLAVRDLSSPLGHLLPSVPAVALALSLADGSLSSGALADACRARWAARDGAGHDTGGDAWAQWWPITRPGESMSIPPSDDVDFEQLIARLARLGYFL